MDHATAVQTGTGDKYLLGELTAAQEDEFAEHFFDCDECANDLRMTSLFVDTTKHVLATDRERELKPKVIRSAGWWQSARYAVAASVALFAFTLYQNTVTIPRLQQASAPQALEYFSLTSMGSRSAGQTVIAPAAGRSFVLVIDIPPQQGAAAYQARILNPSGTQVLSIEIPEQMAKNSVPLLIPASTLKQGDYVLALSSRAQGSTSFTEFERNPLHVN
jgi:hypothetical protein